MKFPKISLKIYNLCMAKKFDRSLIPPAPNMDFEKELWKQKIWNIAGVDEVGRGALAGPVAAGAVILPQNTDKLAKLNGVRDSKELSKKKREKLSDVIKEIAVAYSVGFAYRSEIDMWGIAPATRMAATRAVMTLGVNPDHLLIDYISLPKSLVKQTVLVTGDQRSLSIACASIMAKVTRDGEMVRLDEQYPGYGFADNKGYGTEAHRKAIKKLKPSAVHRNTFVLKG
jgi:ribonuclease HII